MAPFTSLFIIFHTRQQLPISSALHPVTTVIDGHDLSRLNWEEHIKGTNGSSPLSRRSTSLWNISPTNHLRESARLSWVCEFLRSSGRCSWGLSSSGIRHVTGQLVPGVSRQCSGLILKVETSKNNDQALLDFCIWRWDHYVVAKRRKPVTRRHVPEELINYHVCLSELSYIV
jgi:hypothetical protein